MLAVILQVVLRDAVGCLERGDDLFGAKRGVARVDDVGQQYQELVAPLTADRVGAANAGRQPLRDRPQQLIAHRVAERVVDVLESIQVDVQHGDGAAGAVRAHHRLIEPVAQQGPVRNVRETVVQREARELVGQFAGDRHVVRHHDGPDDAAEPVVDRRGAGLDGEFHAVAAHQHAVRAESHRPVLDDGARGGRGDGAAGRDVDQSEHIVHRASGSLCLGPAGHPFGDDVEVGDPAPEIRAHHGIADGIERDLCALLFLEQRVGVLGARFLARLQGALRRTPAADIAKHDHRACEHIAAVANRRRAAFDGNEDAAAVDQRDVVRIVGLLARSAHGIEHAVERRARVVVHDLEASREREADGVGRAPGGDQFGCRIEIGYAAGGVDGDHRVRNVGERSLQVNAPLPHLGGCNGLHGHGQLSACMTRRSVHRRRARYLCAGP